MWSLDAWGMQAFLFPFLLLVRNSGLLKSLEYQPDSQEYFVKNHGQGQEHAEAYRYSEQLHQVPCQD